MPIASLNETIIMLVVLALIDVVMISNLLIMVIVGGYETFVSRMDLQGHPDQPEWLSHVNASVLKVKLATAIIGISSIHLLKTFINADNYTDKVLIAQTVIHITFLLSAMAIAYTDKIMRGLPAPGTEAELLAAGVAAPQHSGRRAQRPPHAPRHVALVREAGLQRDLAEGEVAALRQRLGALDSPLHHVFVYRHPCVP